MEFFNHVQKVYNEISYENINLDIPLAIFMIKLLSIKVDFGHFRDKDKFIEYKMSDKPLKLRYYLQVKFREEITEACEVSKQGMDKANKYIEGCFLKRDRWDSNPIPPYEKRTELYEKYLKDKDFDDDIQNKISEWIKPDMRNGSINSDIRGLINSEVHKKYGYQHKHLKEKMIIFMSKFSNKESVKKLLDSMRDVYILGLV